MIDFSLTAKQLEIREKYRDFADRFIRPNRMKYDESCEFPWDIVKQAYKEGLMNGPVPLQWGGNGYNIFEGALGSEELGAACVGIGICIDANTLALTPLLLSGTEDQQKKYFGLIKEQQAVAAYCLTEPNAGSDVAGIKSTAILKGDKYILSLSHYNLKKGKSFLSVSSPIVRKVLLKRPAPAFLSITEHMKLREMSNFILTCLMPKVKK